MISETGDLPEDDARLLRRFEWLLVALVALLVAAHGRDEAWPFIVWPMYARGYPPPPPRVSETELRLVCRDGSEPIDQRIQESMPGAAETLGAHPAGGVRESQLEHQVMTVDQGTHGARPPS